MLREILLRLVVAVLLPLGLLVIAVAAVPIILFGRTQQRTEIARGSSRALSGIWDGQGDCTFSGWSYHMLVRGKTWGPFRVWLVDLINGRQGHSYDAYLWHQKHALFDSDEVQ